MKKQPQYKPTFSFERNWDQIGKIEAALGKVLRTPDTLGINQEQLESILSCAKKILKFIDILKHEQKRYKDIEEEYSRMQTKIGNHQNIINNLEKSFNERTRSLTEEARIAKDQMQKLRKNVQQVEEQCKSTVNTIKYEKIELEERVANLQRTKERLLQQLTKKDEELKQCEDMIKRLKSHAETDTELPPKGPQFMQVMCSQLAHKVVGYLNPFDALNLRLLNKEIRMYLLKSKTCGEAISRSVATMKNRKISYFHQHIEYFQKLCQKIPEQILHTTFYQYHIAKESIGPQILSILNSSALIFEGKFMDVDGDENNNQIATDSFHNKVLNEAYNNYLEVDQQIIRQYIEQKKGEKDKTMKEIDLMYKKIQTTAQLYSADVEGIGLFLKNVLKNFSKVFVLSKNLYSQARNLQCLNQYLLNQLNQWDKSDIKSTSTIEDLRAELEAEKRLKLFFTDKSQKSEKKALSEQNSKLNIEMKYSHIMKNLDQVCHERKILQTKLEETQKNLKTLLQENRELKKAYEAGKEKYHQIIEELSVVKETIIRMNLV